MKIFTNIKGLGPIYCELMLIATDYADLFIAKDKNNNRYIAMILNDEQDYLLSSVKTNVLLKLLSSEITIRDAILCADSHYILYLEQYPVEGTYIDVISTSLTDNQLPDKGIYLGFSNESIKSFINTVKLENSVTAPTVLRISRKKQKQRNVPTIEFQMPYRPVACAKKPILAKVKSQNNRSAGAKRIGIKIAGHSKANEISKSGLTARASKHFGVKTTKNHNTITKRGYKKKG